jgi:large subunit ribosomal protein L6
MSKIGKKPITLTSAKVQIQGNRLTITGPKTTFTHDIPESFVAAVDGKLLTIKTDNNTRENRVLWGMHRALLANKVKGVETGFEQKVTIVGLGFKAQLAGQKITLTLGYTHKIDYTMPKEVTLEIDKTGQQLLFKSSDKFLLGNVCDAIRSFRPPEPYKGTGVIREGEVVIRKAGKTKAAA